MLTEVKEINEIFANNDAKINVGLTSTVRGRGRGSWALELLVWHSFIRIIQRVENKINKNMGSHCPYYRS